MLPVGCWYRESQRAQFAAWAAANSRSSSAMRLRIESNSCCSSAMRSSRVSSIFWTRAFDSAPEAQRFGLFDRFSRVNHGALPLASISDIVINVRLCNRRSASRKLISLANNRVPPRCLLCVALQHRLEAVGGAVTPGRIRHKLCNAPVSILPLCQATVIKAAGREPCRSRVFVILRQGLVISRQATAGKRSN